MTGTISALANGTRTGTIRMPDGSRLMFHAAGVLGEFDTLAVGHRVSFEIERDRSHFTAVRVFREPVCSSAASRKDDSALDLRYAGFDQAGSVRRYRFEAVTPRSSVQHWVTVDVALLLKHRIGIQEIPALCLQKLTADLGRAGSGPHELAEDDLVLFAVSRGAVQQKKPRHRLPVRRGAPPPAPAPDRRAT